jgi:glutamate 5-kinase
LAFGVATSPLKVWLSNRLQVAGTLIVSDAVAEMIVAGKRGLNREDVISIQGDFMKGDVLHIYSAAGKECARGLANFSSQEIMMLARNIEQTVEQVLGYMTKSAVISAENLLVLEDHHLPWDAPEDAPKLVTHS